MQAVAKAAIAESARGVSTALAVWAGCSHPICPACSPVVHCAELPHLPDCICSADGRHVIEKACPLLLLPIVFALFVGIVVGYWLAQRTTTIGSPVGALEEAPSSVGLGLWGDGRSGPAPPTRRSRAGAGRGGGVGTGD